MLYYGHETSRVMQEVVQEESGVGWGRGEDRVGGAQNTYTTVSYGPVRAILATGHYRTLPFNTSPTRGLRQPFSQLLFPEEVSPPPLH